MKRVMIFYSHFAPAFKAGGPVQSLVNLVENLRSDFSFFVVCEAKDMGDTMLLEGIQPDAWNEHSANVKVYYIRKSSYKAVKFALREIDPDIVYVNGMFTPIYNWLPLYLAKQQGRNVILAPRGMLQKGALAIKPFKKKCFLLLFRMLGIHKQIKWHATDVQEKVDIRQLFGSDARVEIATNIPKLPAPTAVPRIKNAGQLRMIYLSLITEKKNLHLVLKALNEIKTPVQFDIYGPLKDEAYWRMCQQLIEGQMHEIRYQGIVNPADVQQTLSRYHVLILPTKGENFGHAIYEALSVGTPALISPFTPWGQLQNSEAGITINSENVGDWSRAIQCFVDFDQPELEQLSGGAHRLAYRYYSENDFKSAYLTLFA
jgi:glycosyltransferase involved in cell wall biosynthesis